MSDSTIRRSFYDYLALLAGQGGAVVLTIINTSLLTRILGQGGYGHVAVFVMVTQVLFTVVAGWLSTALVRYGCEEWVAHQSLRRSLGARLILVAPLLGVGLVGLGVAWQPLCRYLETPGWGAGLIALSVVGSIALVTVQSLVQARGVMKAYAWMLLVERASVCLGLVLLIGVGLPHRLFWCLTLVAAAPWLAALMGVRWLPSRCWWPPQVDRAWIRRTWTFSWPLVLGVLAATVATWADVALTNQFLHKDDVGVYALARQIATLLKQAAILASALIAPMVFRSFASGRRAGIQAYISRILPLGILGWCSLVGLVIPVMWLLVPVIWGTAFTASRWPLLVLASEVGLSVWYYWGVPVLTAHEEAGPITVINVMTAALVPLIGWWAVPRAGIVGSAWAVLLTSLTAQILVIVYLRRRGPLSWGWCGLTLTPVLVSVGLCAWIGPLAALLGTVAWVGCLGRWVWAHKAFLAADDWALLRKIQLPAWAHKLVAPHADSVTTPVQSISS